jgi:hypothetical protein
MIGTCHSTLCSDQEGTLGAGTILQAMPLTTTLVGLNEVELLLLASTTAPTLTMFPAGIKVCHIPVWTTPFSWPVPEVPDTSQFLQSFLTCKPGGGIMDTSETSSNALIGIQQPEGMT